MDHYTIRTLCDIADKYAEGFMRFTMRSNVEIPVSSAAKVEPLIKALEEAGFPVGGTNRNTACP